MLSQQRRNKVESDIKDYMQNSKYICYAVQNISVTTSFPSLTFKPDELSSYIFNQTNPMEYNAWFKQRDGKYTEIIVYPTSAVKTDINGNFQSYGETSIFDEKVIPYSYPSVPFLGYTLTSDSNSNNIWLSTDIQSYILLTESPSSNAAHPLTESDHKFRDLTKIFNNSLIHASSYQDYQHLSSTLEHL